jgi:two-component system LytT family response regulator
MKETTEIGIQQGNEIHFLQFSEIIYILAEGSVCHLLLFNQKKITVPKKLKELEDVLPRHFFRIHNSHIVNLHHVEKFLKTDNTVVMSDDQALNVSKYRKKELLERFQII